MIQEAKDAFTQQGTSKRYEDLSKFELTVDGGMGVGNQNAFERQAVQRHDATDRLQTPGIETIKGGWAPKGDQRKRLKKVPKPYNGLSGMPFFA